MNPLEKYPLVMIDWLDHTASAEWEDNPEKVTYEVCRTIGWLVSEDKKSFKVANAVTKDSGMGGISVILKSCIEDFWYIEMSDEKG